MAYRALTSGEIKLAQTLFGDQIDYNRVRLYNTRVLPKKIQAENRAMAFLNKISFPNNTYAKDFSKEPDVLKKSIFLHELVHVWQLQNDIVHPVKAYLKEMAKVSFNKKASYEDCYLYVLKQGKPLTDYGFEQQAALIQDYFILQTGHTTASYKNRRQNKTLDPHTLQTLYRSTIKDILPHTGKKPSVKPPKP